MHRVLHFMADIQVCSGVATVVMNYYRHIDRNRIQFDFLYFEDSPLSYEREIRSLGGRVFRIPRPSLLSLGEICTFFSLHQGEFWILHCHPVWSAAVLEPLARRCGVHTIILHSHSEKPGESRTSILRNQLLLRLSAGRVDMFFACSCAAEASFMGIPHVVYILPNAIDARKFFFDDVARQSCRRQLGINPDAPVIGHVGRMVDVKNHRFILEMFSTLRQNMPAAQLLLIGDGPLKQELYIRAAELGIQDSVHFLGTCRDISPLYAAMDMFVMPSLYEGLSMALLEAQASGLPCLISDRVSLESNVTNRMTSLALEEPEEWANVLEKQLKTTLNRSIGIKEAFERSNLDIHTAARELTVLYERS